MKTRREPIFNWALWAGIAIWVVSFVGIILSSAAPGKSFITETVKEDGAIVGLIVFAIIIPLVEEISFRFWAIRRWRWAGYVSSVGIGYVIYLYGGLWAALAIAMVIAAIVWLVKEERTRILILLATTSILFAILHYDNYGNLQLRNIFALINHLGFALVAAWQASASRPLPASQWEHPSLSRLAGVFGSTVLTATFHGTRK